MAFCRYHSTHLHPETDYEDEDDESFSDNLMEENDYDVTTEIPGSFAKVEQSSRRRFNIPSIHDPYTHQRTIACSYSAMSGLPSRTRNAFAYNPNENRPATSLPIRQHTTYPGHSRARTPDPSSLHTGIVRREDGQEENNPSARPRKNAICGNYR